VSTTTAATVPALADVKRELREVAAARAQSIDRAEAQALAVRLDELRDVALDAMRAEEIAAAAAAREAGARRVRVHPGAHRGPCPPPGTFTLTEAELRPIAGDSSPWHLDADVARPEWWPLPLVFDQPPG